ncbi:hypothetical protein YC2023_033848 [Brassica napus]|uniref:Uncharacterized protein n=3 Tax=Brassica TaxID=3705 RepID=A0A0D3AZB9_BRAOL|nr:unnamed protein product [Brassica napus]VDC84936.1 unnamed protein product [Brassica oleracea]
MGQMRGMFLKFGDNIYYKYKKSNFYFPKLNAASKRIISFLFSVRARFIFFHSFFFFNGYIFPFFGKGNHIKKEIFLLFGNGNYCVLIFDYI